MHPAGQTRVFPTEISNTSKLSVPLPLDSPAASYASLMADELSARGWFSTPGNIKRILTELVNLKAAHPLPRTARMQQIYNTLFTGINAPTRSTGPQPA